MNRHLILTIVCLVTSCIHSEEAIKPNSTFPAQANSTRSSYLASSDKGMITSAHPQASQAGLEILKEGGNAVDAAIAVSMAVSVVRPQSTGIGGGGFLLHFHKGSGSVKAYDFRETAPSNASRDMYLDKNGEPKDGSYRGKIVPNISVNGHHSVATPGLIMGLWKIHKKHGSLPWKRLVQPAIKLAKEGFVIYPSLEKAILRRYDILNTFPSTRKIFLPKGKAPVAGDILIQKDLARTLESIAFDGAAPFYEGWIAKSIADEVQEGGGVLSMHDLSSYKMKERTPISTSFYGHKLFSMPPPSSGGVHIAQMLNILEDRSLHKLKHHSVEYINLLVEVMRRAYADRAEYLGDTDFIEVPVDALISKEYARKLSKELPLGKAGNSNEIGPGTPTSLESPSTTHLSIVDQWGNGVSSTQTINYTFGSGVVAEGTGIILNDEMDDFSKKPGVPNAFGLVGSKANEIQPLKRMLSSMSPSFILKDEQLTGIVGSPGGSRIINATLQAIINRYLYKMLPIDAVHSSRIHHQWLPDIVFLEKNTLGEDVTSKLIEMGYTLKDAPFPVGDVQAIFKHEGKWQGISDTRSDGRPLGQ